jgi:ATP-dependent RNA helicase RhlB
MKFSEFPLNQNLLKGLEEAGYVECTPVQAAALEAAFNLKRDIYAQSQTGTGKTAAFLIPAFERLLKDPEGKSFALIVVPTRELADQIQKEAALLGKHLNMKMVTLYGGVSYENQRKALAATPRLIIATPGRLIDFINQNVINTGLADVMVLDEADRLFDMGFIKDIKFIYSTLKPAAERLNMLFSATLSEAVGNLSLAYMNNPADIIIEPEEVTVTAIEQGLFHVNRKEKMMLLLGLLKSERPYTAVIFSNTKAGAAQIAERLSKAGLRCEIIAGNIPQNKRSRIVNEIKAGKIQYLAATDVAARGLHIPNLALVINYDLPEESENYVHRIGRTARAGEKGKAISFACDRYIYNLSGIEKYIGKKIPVFTIDDNLQQAIETAKKEQSARRTTDDNQQNYRRPPHEKAGADSGRAGGRGKSSDKPQQRRQNNSGRPHSGGQHSQYGHAAYKKKPNSSKQSLENMPASIPARNNEQQRPQTQRKNSSAAGRSQRPQSNTENNRKGAGRQDRPQYNKQQSSNGRPQGKPQGSKNRQSNKPNEDKGIFSKIKSLFGGVDKKPRRS